MNTIASQLVQSVCFIIKRTECDTRILLELCHNLLLCKKTVHLPRKYISHRKSLLHALRKLSLCKLSLLCTSCQLIEENKAVRWFKIIQKPDSLVKKVRQKSIHACIHGQLSPFLGKLVCHHTHSVGFLCLHLLSKLVRHPLCLCLKLFNSPGLFLITKYKLCRRIYAHPVCIFDGFLALAVKISDSVYLVSPQLDSDRILLRQRKNIKNTTPDRKLSHRLDLILFFIAHSDKSSLYFLQIQKLSLLKCKHIFPHLFYRRHCIHQRVKGGHKRHSLLLADSLQSPDTLCCQEIAPDIRLVKKHIL